MSWQVPTIGQSSQLRPSWVPLGRSRELMERTRGSERSCLWKRCALLCFLASLIGSWKSRPALPPFLFFPPTPALPSSAFLQRPRTGELACYYFYLACLNNSELGHKLPPSSIGLSSPTSSLSAATAPLSVPATTPSSFLPARQLRSEVTGNAAVRLGAGITRGIKTAY